MQKGGYSDIIEQRVYHPVKGLYHIKWIEQVVLKLEKLEETTTTFYGYKQNIGKTECGLAVDASRGNQIDTLMILCSLWP